jgi:methylase of polypeptide subunit release factors
VDTAAAALIELGRALRAEGYAFITVTPETHRRVLARNEPQTPSRMRVLRDVFGWSKPFARETLPSELLALLQAADQLELRGGVMRSRVRFSTLGDRMFVHSAFPTVEPDAVFFGPDTYRFCALLERWAPPRVQHLVDVGCGSGAGAIVLADRADRVVLADISPRALAFARVNLALAGVQGMTVASDVLHGIAGAPDLIVANPPYLRDSEARVYREGGGALGEGLSVRIVREAVERLAPRGTLIVYTGTSIVEGVDTFRAMIEPFLRERDLPFRYEELDPDVFGEELEQPAYRSVERIAVVGLRVQTQG